MKIIFLDIDGVLVNRKSLRIASCDMADGDPDCVALLNRIIAETDAYIVVSSTWRMDGLMRVREHLYEWGVTKGRVLDITPFLAQKVGSLYMGRTRGTEIQGWLDSYTRHPIESFVILDDDSDMGDLMPFLVHTNTEAGMIEADALKAIELLNKRKSQAA